MALTATMAEIAVYNMLRDAQHAGIGPGDLAFAMKSDIGPWDVAALRAGTAEFKMLLIMRCPKKQSVGFQGVFMAKRMDHAYQKGSKSAVKTGEAGLAAHPDTGEIFVSDYDLMGVWEKSGGGYARVDTGTKPRGQNPVVDKLNTPFFDNRPGENRSPFQHGGQDDFKPPAGKSHPNLKISETCAAFREGEMRHLEGIDRIRAYYYEHQLNFPYDHSGVYKGPSGE